MKGAEHPDLAELVKRLEARNKRRQAGTGVMAALGLIGFGIMMIPILGDGRTQLSKTLPHQSEATTTPPRPSPYDKLSLIGHAAVVYDLAYGRTLFEKNADDQLPLASLTKLLTTYAAATALDPESRITITASALAAEGDSGLTEGETFSVEDLARYALVASSNDAAAAIAEVAARESRTNDRGLLASAAAAMGLTRTYALNGTGLDVSESVSGGYGSALDVAKLSGALLKEAPTIARSTIESSVTIRDSRGSTHTLPNTNQGIVHIPNPLLSKTGFTDLAGGNLVVVFDVGINHPVAVVVLGSTREGRFRDVDVLVDRTLDHFAESNP